MQIQINQFELECWNVMNDQYIRKYIVLIVDWKLISLCLRSDYSLFTYLHIFVYELAESTRISLPYHLILHILYLLYIYIRLLKKNYVYFYLKLFPCKNYPGNCQLHFTKNHLSQHWVTEFNSRTKYITSFKKIKWL